MPMLTPSRLVVFVVSLSLISFFWTFGIPRELPQPGLPIINHEDEPQRELEDWEKPGKLPFTPQTRVSTTPTTFTTSTRTGSTLPDAATHSPVQVGAGGNANKGNAGTTKTTVVGAVSDRQQCDYHYRAYTHADARLFWRLQTCARRRGRHDHLQDEQGRDTGEASRTHQDHISVCVQIHNFQRSCWRNRRA